MNTENIHYKFKLKKLKDDEAIMRASTSTTEIHSDTGVGDLELFSSTPNPALLEGKVDKDLSYSDLYSKDNDAEAKLTEENIDLYNDLLEIEEKERKAKQIHEMEFENLKKEVEKFKELDARNRTRIKELTTENNNLKISISSCYRTAKREIESKNQLLAEANYKLARFTLQRYELVSDSDNGKWPYCENSSNNSTKDNNTSTISKRKRSESPEQSSIKRDCKATTSKIHEMDLQSGKDKRKLEEKSEVRITKNNSNSDVPNNKFKRENFQKQIPVHVKHDKETQTSNDCVFWQSRESCNNRLFDLLPDSLKKSIYDYEQVQVNSLNNLIKKLINDYFNSGARTPPSILETTPKTQNDHIDELASNKSSDVLTPKTTSTPISTTEHCEKTELVKPIRKDELNAKEHKKDSLFSAQNCLSQEPVNSYNSRLSKSEELTLSKTPESISLSNSESTPTSSYKHCKRTELTKKFQKNEFDKTETEKDSVQNCDSKVPKNCYNSRLNKKETLTSNKNSDSLLSSRTESTETSSSSFEHSKKTEIPERFEKDKVNKNEGKSDYARKHASKVSMNRHDSKHKTKDVLNLFRYRNEKVPFEEKKKYGLHKKDYKPNPKKLL